MLDSLRATLSKHYGHDVVISKYGDPDCPADVCLECENCCEVILSAESEETVLSENEKTTTAENQLLAEYCKAFLDILLDLEQGYELVSSYNSWEEFLDSISIPKETFEKATGIPLDTAYPFFEE